MFQDFSRATVFFTREQNYISLYCKLYEISRLEKYIFSLKENSVNSWYILSEKFSSNISEGWPDIGTWPGWSGEIVTERERMKERLND